MSFVKLSQLTPTNNINANPSQSLFLTTDLGAPGTSLSITAAALGTSLYSNNVLIVGKGGTLLPHITAQFSGSDASYLQTNIVNINANGSADMVITGDTGTDSNTYIDLGWNNSQFNNSSGFTATYPNDGYLYTHGVSDQAFSGNLVVGTATQNSRVVITGGGMNVENIAAWADRTGFRAPLIETAISANLATAKAYANTIVAANATIAQTYTNTANTFLQANDALIRAAAQTAYDLANSANIYAYASNTYLQNYAVANATITFVKQDLTVPGNLIVTGTSNVGVLRTGNLIIIGTSVANGNSIVNGTLTSNGNFQVVGTSNVSGTSIVYGAFTSNGTSNLVGNVFVTGSFIANGVANIVGQLNITGNSSQGGFLSVNNATYNLNTALLTLSASNNYAVVAPSNTAYMIQMTGPDNVPTRMIMDSFGSATYSVIAGRSGRGTASSPAQTQSGDVLMRIAGNGYGSNGFTGSGGAYMQYTASENWSNTRGTQVELWTTANGSNTLTQTMVWNSNRVIFGSLGNTIVDIANSRIQVSNTNANTAFAVSYINRLPIYPNGSPGDKKGMMYFDAAGNVSGGGGAGKMYWCDVDYTTGGTKIWYYGGQGGQGTWV